MTLIRVPASRAFTIFLKFSLEPTEKAFMDDQRATDNASVPRFGHPRQGLVAGPRS